MKEARNITLTLPADLLRKAKVLAAQRETSVSRLVAGVLEDLVETENGYALAKQRSLDRLAEPRPLGTKGRIEWQREELHER